MLNAYVSDDFGDPNHPKFYILHCFLYLHSGTVGELRGFKFSVQVDHDHIKSQITDDKLSLGERSRHVTRF